MHGTMSLKFSVRYLPFIAFVRDLEQNTFWNFVYFILECCVQYTFCEGLKLESVYWSENYLILSS